MLWHRVRAGGGKAIFVSPATYWSNISANVTSFKSIRSHEEAPLSRQHFSFSWFTSFAQVQLDLLLIPRRSSLISAQLLLNKRLFSLHQSVSNLSLRAGLGNACCETLWLQPLCTGQVPKVSTRHVSGSSLLLAQQKKHKEEQKKKIPFTMPVRNVMGNCLAPYSQIPNEDLAIQEQF